ncbi:MAG: nickel pincer cofactor biosynthesis protein LarC [Ardenticatenales bacterium]|nr:nickel pincer cofactor biosynthesis protein LarC [Ardenticatenales bacterium]
MLAYLDTPSGISGDMFLGCLVDAGWPIEALRETIHHLNWPADFDHASWSVAALPVMKGPLRATQVLVQASEVGQPHRHLSDIRTLLEGSQLAEPVLQDTIAVFERLAQAEGTVHGQPPEKIHFHEVGALDSIIDIVGVCAGIHALGITKLHAGALPLGPGFTQSQHGQLPLPAPATLELLAQAQAPIKAAPGPGELVTPTGAALVTHFVAGRWRQPEMRLQRVALGGGQKDFAWPNVARLWLGEDMHAPREGSHAARMSLLESNIDDMNPEFYAAVAERLFAHGARDVWLTPLQMKKNRPGVMLSVLAMQEDETDLARLLLSETTTLGMRVYHVGRYEAARRMEQVDSPYGPIPVKLKLLDGVIIGAVPEYDACQAAALHHDVATRLVYEAASALAWQRFLAPPATKEQET